ncbi:hypothetical protein ACHAWF_003985 [Thalassiosira exigua]
MASSRESERRSASACACAASHFSIDADDGSWRLVSEGEEGGSAKAKKKRDPSSSAAAPGDDDDDGALPPDDSDLLLADDSDGDDDVAEGGGGGNVERVECAALAPGTTVRVPPLERTRGGWSSDNFHPSLRLPQGCSPGKGLVVTFEAMGRECVAVALSPHHDYEMGKTYVVHFGANGNLQTVLRRHVNYGECVDASFPGRVCAEDRWVPYWIVLRGGKLSAGVGRVPGKECVGTLDDSMYDALRSGADAVKYVGIGNSALRRDARDVRVRNVVVAGTPSRYGPGGVPIEEGGKFVNVMELGYGGGGAGGGGGSSAGPTDAELLAEYERERAKAKARAAKFGIEYKEPGPDAFLKWSEARRLRANPERGFVTGIDTFSKEERAKADARKERFAREERKRKGFDPDMDDVGGGTADANATKKEDDEEAIVEDDDDDDMDEGVDDVAEWEKTKRDPLPTEQAWDNWAQVARFRVDPPPGLLSPDGAANDEDADDVVETDEFVPQRATLVPAKIHVFSVDWCPFKQIRTDDLMAYFRDYGPGYVEWLGELSCNVHFGDRHSAERAMRAMSRELPSPPPPLSKKLNWEPPKAVGGEAGGGDEMEEIKERWGPNGTEVVKKEEPIQERWGANGTEVMKEEEPIQERWGGNGTEVMKEEEGATDDEVGDEGKGTMEETDGSLGDGADNGGPAPGGESATGASPPDLGGMGWRFCKWTVRKVSDDRYGRRGTRARVLMRPATSLDVLDDRPTEWPKPPPGFTTRRVLMPWHDFSGRRRPERRRGDGGGRREAKRRRRGGGRRSHGRNDRSGDDYAGKEHPSLSKGLRSGRSGFSVEELEAERNAKNAEILSVE